MQKETMQAHGPRRTMVDVTAMPVHSEGVERMAYRIYKLTGGRISVERCLESCRTETGTDELFGEIQRLIKEDQNDGN